MQFSILKTIIFRFLLGIGLLLLTWWLASLAVTPLLPTPRAVAAAAKGLFLSGQLTTDLKISLFRVSLGVVIASLAAFFLFSIGEFFNFIIDPMLGLVDLLRPIPPIAWIPLAIMLFGIGEKPAVAIVAFGAFFPVWLGLVYGLSQRNIAHVLAAQSLGASRWQLFFDVTFPSVLPHGLHGLRLGIGIGWFSVVAAEMMGASSGLGYGIQLFSLNIEMEKFYVYLISISLCGLGLNALANIIENVASPHARQRTRKRN